MTFPVKVCRIVLVLGLLALESSNWGAQGDGQNGMRPPTSLRHTALEPGDRSWRPASLESDPMLGHDPTFVIMERRFLDGTITAKQFARFIREHGSRLNRRAATNAPALPVLATTAPAQSKQPSAAPRRPPKPAAEEDDFEPLDVSALEDKMSELVRLRDEREKASQTNVVRVDFMDPKSKLSKRERLDLLLKLYVENKISPAEYKEKRAKIMAMP